MSLPLKTGLPDGLTLSAGYVVRFTATDPATGALVTGVKVSHVSIFGDALGQVPESPLLEPFYLPVPTVPALPTP